MKTNNNREIIHIANEEQIIERLQKQGDLREDDGSDYLVSFEVYSDDDLGFYQQATEFLLTQMASNGLNSDIKIKRLYCCGNCDHWERETNLCHDCMWPRDGDDLCDNWEIHVTRK